MPEPSSEGDILDHYVTTAPSAQNAVDLFRSQWASRFPPSAPAVSRGEVQAFEDTRLAWGLDRLGGMKGKSALELGPFEGGHSYMLQEAGARAVVAVEANTRAFLRCLITKEIFGLDRVHFLLGDFVEHLRLTTETYDICVAAGVLYHMRNPVELIDLISRRSPAVYCWTHYYDPQRGHTNVDLQQVTESYNDFEYQPHRFRYSEERARPGFCGPATSTAVWMTRDDIERCCRHFGFNRFETAFDLPDHPHGPSFAFVASR